MGLRVTRGVSTTPDKWPHNIQRPRAHGGQPAIAKQKDGNPTFVRRSRIQQQSDSKPATAGAGRLSHSKAARGRTNTN